MRRILTLLCLCVLTLALAGCQEDKTKSPDFDPSTLKDPGKAMEGYKEAGGPGLGAPGKETPAAAPEKDAE